MINMECAPRSISIHRFKWRENSNHVNASCATKLLAIVSFWSVSFWSTSVPLCYIVTFDICEHQLYKPDGSTAQRLIGSALDFDHIQNAINWLWCRITLLISLLSSFHQQQQQICVFVGSKTKGNTQLALMIFQYSFRISLRTKDNSWRQFKMRILL